MIVLDTNVDDLMTTAIAIAEVRYGIARLPDSARTEQLRRAADDVFAAFARQILPFDAAAAPWRTAT